MLIRKIIILIVGLGVLSSGIGQEKVGTIAEEPVSTDSIAPVFQDTLLINKESEKSSADTITKVETSAAKDTVIESEAEVTETVAPVDSPMVSDSGATIELPGDDEIIMVDDKGLGTEGDSLVDTLPPIEKMPELTKFVEAKYPEKIYKQGIEGTVLMELIVSDSGKVDSASIIKGIHPVLDSNALDAAFQFVFTPAIAGGEPVPVLIQYEYRFELKEIVKKIEKYVNFSGKLIERGTKKPIADAMVVIHFIDTLSDTTLPVPFSVYLEKLGTFEGQYLEENRLVTITDSLGHFSFYSLPSCNIEITAPLPGYEEFKEEEFITPNEVTEVKYYVRRISYSDYEIVVYGKTEKKEVSRRQLTITEVKKIPGLGGDAVKVVQALPGVGRPTFGSGQVIVRGARTWDSHFYLDGVDIPQLYHFGGIKSTYHSDALESVDFYPGGFGTRYGDAVAGVIEIKSRDAKRDRWQGFGDISFQDGSFMVEGPIKEKMGLIVSARRSFAGELLSWFLEKSDLNVPYTVTPFYWDYIARLNMDINKDNTAFVTAFGSKDRLDFFYPAVQGGSKEIDEDVDKLKMELQFHMGIGGWDWNIRENLKNSLRYSFTHGYNFISPFGFMKMREDYNEHYIRNQLSFLANDKLTWNFGADISFLFEDLILIIPDQSEIGGVVRDTSDNWIFGDIAAYVNLEWRPAEQWLIIPGIRYDYYSHLNYDGSLFPEFWNYHDFDNARGISGEPSLRLTARYEFIKNHTAKIAIGSYNQSPQPGGQVIHEKWGDPTIPATKCAHYVLGYEWQITDLIHLDLQGYINRQWDVPRLATENDADPTNIWYDDDKRRMRGIEIMLRHDQSERFFGWLAYSLSRSEDYSYSENKYVLFDDDETHHIQLLGSWHLKRDWDIGFRARFVTGKPESPIDSVEYVANWSGYYNPIFGDENSVRVKPFFQIDIRVDKKFVFDKWMFSIYLDMQNLSYFLYKSPEFTVYNYDYSDKQTVSNIFFPALGFRAEF